MSGDYFCNIENHPRNAMALCHLSHGTDSDPERTEGPAVSILNLRRLRLKEVSWQLGGEELGARGRKGGADLLL